MRSPNTAVSCALLQEVCARLSLPLQPVALEGGRYFVLMPADETVSLSVAGEAFVIDPYSEGMLLSVTEVRRLPPRLCWLAACLTPLARIVPRMKIYMVFFLSAASPPGCCHLCVTAGEGAF